MRRPGDGISRRSARSTTRLNTCGGFSEALSGACLSRGDAQDLHSSEKTA